MFVQMVKSIDNDQLKANYLIIMQDKYYKIDLFSLQKIKLNNQ